MASSDEKWLIQTAPGRVESLDGPALVALAERSARDLAAVKARESAVKDAIRRGEPEVDCGPFGASQLGLLPVVADEWGRLWVVRGQKMTLAGERPREGK